MTEKQLKKLSRRELLEMLVLQTRKVEQLEKQLEEANRKLNDKMIVIENSGSLADAVMQLNGVFEAAQAACEQYVDVVRRRMHAEEQQTREKCDRLLALAREAAYADEGDYQD